MDDITERAAALIATEGPATPLFLARKGGRGADLADAPEEARAWLERTGFRAEAGAFAFAPAPKGDACPSGVVAALGLGDAEPLERIGAAPSALAPAPDGAYALAGAGATVDGAAAALEWALGGYRFAAYRAPAEPGPARLRATAADWAAAEPTASAVHLGRDLINTPASDLGPAALEAAVAAMAARFGAEMSVVTGDALLERNHPMIHAVGRAGPEAPRLIDLVWGPADAPKVTLVGKGVCFDTGGLDIKPARAMRLMKKDMGGAAAAIALAWMAMASGLKARLRLLIPAVENSVGSASFRPGDVLRSRKGLTVEIGDTDAEGRLVLADAMAAADEEAPDLLIDLATLTGAARVALGAEIAPFYTDDPALAAALETASAETRDPLWRMPLWKPYAKDLSSTVADLGNISTSGFAGSVTAALFLSRFVERAGAWAHFDIYAWNPKTRPGRPEGGEVHAARALHHLLRARYGTGA